MDWVFRTASTPDTQAKCPVQPSSTQQYWGQNFSFKEKKVLYNSYKKCGRNIAEYYRNFQTLFYVKYVYFRHMYTILLC